MGTGTVSISVDDGVIVRDAGTMSVCSDGLLVVVTGTGTIESLVDSDEKD